MFSTFYILTFYLIWFVIHYDTKVRKVKIVTKWFKKSQKYTGINQIWDIEEELEQQDKEKFLELGGEKFREYCLSGLVVPKYSLVTEHLESHKNKNKNKQTRINDWTMNYLYFKF